MTTPTARSSEEVDVADLHGPQQHDGVVQKEELEEVEAPQKKSQIQSPRRGAARVLGGGSNVASLGAGVQGFDELRPSPPLILYRGLGGRPRHPQGPRAGAHEGGEESFPPTTPFPLLFSLDSKS